MIDELMPLVKLSPPEDFQRAKEPREIADNQIGITTGRYYGPVTNRAINKEN